MRSQVTPNERIADLRVNMGLSQKELSQQIHVNPAQLSRIESGETKHISSDLLIKFAKAFHVSTDYLLGLTSISIPKNYEISELGLSEAAVRALITQKMNMLTVSRLLENKKFPFLVDLITGFWNDSISAGAMARNDVISLATASLTELSLQKPEKQTEIRQNVRFLNEQKLGKYEAESEMISKTFLAILREIKKELKNSDQPETLIAAESAEARKQFNNITKNILETYKNRPQPEFTVDDLMEVLLQQLNEALPLNEQQTAAFRELFKQILVNPNDLTES